MKNWSFTKILLVAGVGFVGVVALAVIAISTLAQPQTGSGATSKPRASETAAQRAGTGQALLGPDIVSVQLEGAQAALREARDETKRLEQKLQAILSQRDEQLAQMFSSVNEELQKLNNRMVVLEESMRTQGGFAIVKPQRFVETENPPEAVPVKDAAEFSPPPGFTVRAEMGDRVWMTDGKREISALKSELRAQNDPEAKKTEKR